MIKDISVLAAQVLNNIENPKATTPKPKKEQCTKDNLYDFIKQFHLNESLARNWYEWHNENGFKDKQGKIIKNWKGALLNYCRSKENGIIRKATNDKTRKPLNLWR